jgi:hypothetical protein
MQRELVAPRRAGGFFNESLELLASCDLPAAEVQLVETAAERVHGIHLDSLAQAQLVAD